MVKSVEGAPEVSKWKAPAFIFSEGEKLNGRSEWRLGGIILEETWARGGGCWNG